MLLGFCRMTVTLSLLLALSACWPEEDVDTTDGTTPVRGLITTLISDVEEVTIRRYRGVLEPSEVMPWAIPMTVRFGGRSNVSWVSPLPHSVVH